MKRKVLSCVLSLLMVLTMLPVYALAVETQNDENLTQNDENLTQNDENLAQNDENLMQNDENLTQSENSTLMSDPAPVSDPAPAVVAEVGDTTYETLEEAIAAANGQEIVLQSNAFITTNQTWTNVNINCNNYFVQVAKGAELTISGSETKLFSQNNNRSILRVVGTVNIEEGSYTSEHIEPIIVWGTANISGGTFTSTATTTQENKFDGQGVIVVNGLDGGVSCPGTLNMTGGTIIVDDQGTNPNYAMHGLTLFNGATATLGVEGSQEGPEIRAKYTAIGMNNYQDPINLTIHSGTYTSMTVTNDDRYNAVLFMTAKSDIRVTGGDFTAATTAQGKENYVFSIPYSNVDVKLDISGGNFHAAAQTFRPVSKQTGADKPSGSPSVAITGGTYTEAPGSADQPGSYVAHISEGYKTVQVGDNYTVKAIADTIIASMDTTQSGGVTSAVTGNGFALTGSVDMRTYTVTDPELQTLFSSLLTDKRVIPDEPAQITETGTQAKYVDGRFKLVFAILKFDGLETDGHYWIQQNNPGFATAYPDLASGKGRVYTAAELADGLAFLVSDKQGDITIKIAPCDGDATALPAAGVKTITIANSVAFDESVIEEGEAVVTVAPTVTGNTAQADVKENDITANVEAAAEAGKLTIEVPVSDDNVTKTTVTLPRGGVDAVIEKGNVGLEIKTSLGVVTLPAEAVEKLEAESGNVTITVEQVAEHDVPGGADASFKVEVKVGSDDPVDSSNPLENQMITLRFFIGTGLAEQNPTLYYYHDGKFENISSQYNAEDGYITARVPHLSEYALVKTPVIDGGLGKQIAVNAEEDQFVTVQVASSTDKSNAIFTLKVSDTGKVEFTVPVGSIVSYWVTTTQPEIDAEGTVTPSGNGTIVVTQKVIHTNR